MLIVCEGRETEPNYFHGLKREDPVRERFTVTVKRGKGGSREQVAQEAIDRKKEYEGRIDEAWCVMDVEGPSQRDSLDRALGMLNANDISVCLSNPAFEVWLLAHFEKSGSVFEDCDKVIIRLSRQWHMKFEAEYHKNDREIFQRLAPMTETAISHARWVRQQHHSATANTCDCNSSTDVHVLVGRLLGCGSK